MDSYTNIYVSVCRKQPLKKLFNFFFKNPQVFHKNKMNTCINTMPYLSS